MTDPNAIEKVVNGVVNNLCAKTGVAVDKLQPLGEQMVREYAASQWVGCIAGLIACVTIAIFVVIMAKKVYKSGHELIACGRNADAEMVGATILSVSGVLATIGSFVIAIYFLLCAVSPTYHCLLNLFGK